MHAIREISGERTMSVGSAAHITGLHPATVRRALLRGDLEGYRPVPAACSAVPGGRSMTGFVPLTTPRSPHREDRRRAGAAGDLETAELQRRHVWLHENGYRVAFEEVLENLKSEVG